MIDCIEGLRLPGRCDSATTAKQKDDDKALPDKLIVDFASGNNPVGKYVTFFHPVRLSPGFVESSSD